MTDEEVAAKSAEEDKEAEGATETGNQTPEEAEKAKAEAAEKEKGAKGIPEEEWQKRVEEVKKEAKEEAVKHIAEKLGVKPEEKGDEDPLKALTSTVEKLKKDTERSKWEAKHPWVLHEDNVKGWDETNEESRFATLTYDERMVQAGITEPEKEDSDSKSVPSFNKVTPSGGTIKEVEEWRARNKQDIWNPKD